MEDIKKVIKKIVDYEEETKVGKVSTVKLIDSGNKDIPKKSIVPFSI